jgi:RimJ/RimL family protein N-acetyltransferase
MDLSEFCVLPAQRNDEDGKLVMLWRNDPVTQKMSFNQKHKEWKDFKLEYYEGYFHHTPLFVAFQGEKIAFVSIMQKEGNDYLIGINLDPKRRGKRLSTPVLVAISDYVRKQMPHVKRIVAEIKDENVASKKTFVRAGYVYAKTENRMIHEKEYKVHTYLYSML